MSLSITTVLWQIAFWLSVALLVIPFPFKIYGYVNGSDKSPLKVKIDESVSVLLSWIGLLGFYGYLYGGTFLAPLVWYAWIVVMTIGSLTALWWSPKMEYAQQILGRRNFLILYGFSLVLYIPMLWAVCIYAGAI